MNQEIKVKKWGGENASELIKSPLNIVEDFKKWIKQAVIVSAIREPEYNTTDNLIELWNMLWKKNIDFDSIKAKVEEIRDFHIKISKEKWVNNIEKIINFITEKFYKLLMKITYNISSHHWIFPRLDNDFLVKWIDKEISILWFWEIISAEIQSFIINDLEIEWLNSEAVGLKNITKDIENISSENEIFKILSTKISEQVLEILEKWKIPIIPWYISWFKNWIENTIWRWYSDATASMTAVWLSYSHEVTLEIQKSVEWMLSADPRIIKWNRTKLIETIDYLTAKEITWVRWAQAKLLHSQVLRKELQNSWINVHLFDPFQNTKWTIISKNKCIKSSWVEYIWWRDNITVFSVSSWDMNSKWILSQISLIANEYASIDIVSTSETEISFTIEWNLTKKQLEELSSRIRISLNIKEDGYENFVRYNENKALVFCIWQNLSHNLWSLWRAATALSSWWINIEMVSQWTMERAIIFWIESSKLNNAINLLHEEFINTKN